MEKENVVSKIRSILWHLTERGCSRRGDRQRCLLRRARQHRPCRREPPPPECREDIGGTKKFKDLLEAMAVTESDDPKVPA
jgi:hypothetical protein